MQPTSTRQQDLAALYAEHHRSLPRLVAQHTSTDPDTIDDACSFAWTQLLTHHNVDLTVAHWSSLAWLTTTATREAWRLHRQARQNTATDEHTQQTRRHDRDTDRHAPDAATIAEQHERLALVTQIPERPRRFLLRLMLGYSYREISTHEGASITTTNKQIARAKRLLRQIQASHDAGEKRADHRARA